MSIQAAVLKANVIQEEILDEIRNGARRREQATQAPTSGSALNQLIPAESNHPTPTEQVQPHPAQEQGLGNKQDTNARPGPTPWMPGFAFGDITSTNGPITVKHIGGDHNISTVSNNISNTNSGNVTNTTTAHSNNIYGPMGTGEAPLCSSSPTKFTNRSLLGWALPQATPV